MNLTDHLSLYKRYVTSLSMQILRERGSSQRLPESMSLDLQLTKSATNLLARKKPQLYYLISLDSIHVQSLTLSNCNNCASGIIEEGTQLWNAPLTSKRITVFAPRRRQLERVNISQCVQILRGSLPVSKIECSNRIKFRFFFTLEMWFFSLRLKSWALCSILCLRSTLSRL